MPLRDLTPLLVLEEIWREKGKRQQQDRRERERERMREREQIVAECPDTGAGQETEERSMRRDGGCRLVGTEPRNEAGGRRKRRAR